METLQTGEKSEWRAQEARFTVFYRRPGSIGPEAFAKFFGFGPTETTGANRFFGEYIAIKSRVGFRLNLEIERADFCIFPAELDLDQFPVIPFELDLDEVLLKPARALLFEVETFHRIAFGLKLLLPLPDRNAAYEKVNSLLKSVNVSAEDSSDLLFRINHPRNLATSIGDVKINRIGNWSAQKMEMHRLDESNEMPIIVANAAQVEADFNTGYEHDLTELTPEERVTIAEELYNQSWQLALKGES